MEATCDVWHTENGETIEADGSLNIPSAKKLMRKLKAEGKKDIRMYAYYSDTCKSLYYSFVDGKIVKEDNNFDN